MQPIDLKVTIDTPMPEAQAQLLDRMESRMRSVHFAGRADGDAVTYRPKFIGLPTVWLIRRLSNEHVTFTFEEQGQVTEVRATGKLRPSPHAEVTQAFGGD
jgi:hypothetical protein